jgi:hypothetical protein
MPASVCHFAFSNAMPKPRGNARKSRRNKRRGRRAPPLPMTFVPGPSAQRRIFAYENVIGLTEGAAGTGAFNSYRLNSIYDPDFTGGGTSALGYSTYSYMYGRYRVLRCRVFLRFVNNTGTPTGGIIVGVICTSNSTFSSSAITWAIQPFSSSKVLQGNAGAPHSVCTFNIQPRLHRVAGITPAQFKNDQDYSALFAANPTTSLYAHVFMAGKLSSSAESVRVEVRLIYDTELSMPLASITV